MNLENVTFILNGKFPEDIKPETISLIRERLEHKLIEEIEALSPDRVVIEVESDWEYGDDS